MKHFSRLFSLSAGVLAASTLAASAALLDFTDEDAYTVRTAALASGTIDGIGWTLTPGPAGKNLTYTTGDAPGNINDLEGDFDGVGVSDDEISNTPPEYVTLTFSKAVRITDLYFLDLFVSPENGNENGESALLYAGTPPAAAGFLAEYDAYETFAPGGFGYGEFSGPNVFSTVFSFDAGAGNDDRGVADYALAALEIDPIPLPAGFLLLGTALGGFGLMRRRKS